MKGLVGRTHHLSSFRICESSNGASRAAKSIVAFSEPRGFLLPKVLWEGDCEGDYEYRSSNG